MPQVQLSGCPPRNLRPIDAIIFCWASFSLAISTKYKKAVEVAGEAFGTNDYIAR
jgi:hypothetical protein